jgi:hypothetical protein
MHTNYCTYTYKHLYGKILMIYRLDKHELQEHMRAWNRFLKRKVHLIACGGTAMTLLDVKPSTRDVDFMVPITEEYDYLIKQLKSLGYKSVSGSGWQHPRDEFHFDLFRGNHIHTTELLESPLEDGRHTALIELSRVYIGILNDYDLITSKLMRGTRVDFDDCAMLVKAHIGIISFKKLTDGFDEILKYNTVGEDRTRQNFDSFMNQMKEEGLYGQPKAT